MNKKEEIYSAQPLSTHSRNLPWKNKTLNKCQFDSLIKILHQAKSRGAVYVARGIRTARRLGIEKLQIGGLGKTIVIIAACIFTAGKVHTALHLEGRINQKKLR